MSNFDVAAHLKSNVYRDSDVTEAPESLTVEADEDSASSYYLAPLSDSHSLLWVYLASETFDELLPGYDWCVDDPGTLYAQTDLSGELADDEGERLVPVSVMQPVADELLKRYRAVVEHLRAEGREIEEA